MEFKLNRVKPGSTMLESLGQWAWDSLNSNLDNCAGVENLVGYNAIRMAEGNQLLEDKLTPQLLELYNAAFIISSLEHPQLMTVNRETKMIDYGRDLRIDFLPEAMPRAYWVPAALAVPDESAALSAFDQVDFRKTVILTAPETSITVTTDPGYRFDAASVEITGYAPDRVTIAARAPAPGWLVLSDRAYPGWQARLDGQPVRIEKANIMVRAIRFPEGAHEVVFRYRPETLRIGTAVTMAALIAMIGLALFNTGRGSRKRRALDPDAP